MNEPPHSKLTDADMQAAPKAMLRAALRAREIARQTNTPLVIVRDGVLVEEWVTDDISLRALCLVQSAGRTQGTRYFVDPKLLRGADLKLPTTLLRIEPHRLMELVREDLRRYPRSKIGEIRDRIGPELNQSQLKRTLTELVALSVVVMEGERNGARYRLASEK